MSQMSPHYRLRNGAPSKKRIHSEPSAPSDSKQPKRPALVAEHSDAHIQNFPAEIMVKIFEHFDLPELCRIGRVCKSWYELTRYPQFWRRIHVNISNDSWFRLIQILPSCVTYIHLTSDADLSSMKFMTFSSSLARKCPNLETLILHRFSFIRDCIDFYSHLPKKLRILVLTSCKFVIEYIVLLNEKHQFENMSAYACCIEVLDLSRSRFRDSHGQTVTDFGYKRMPNLKKLHLAKCQFRTYLTPQTLRKLHLLNLERNYIGSAVFGAICECGINLTQLYLCWTLVGDGDLIFEESTVLPNLELICLRGCHVTSIGINSLILSCPSLHRVIVGNKVLNPANDYSACNTEIVKVLNGFRYCNHNRKIGCMCE